GDPLAHAPPADRAHRAGPRRGARPAAPGAADDLGTGRDARGDLGRQPRHLARRTAGAAVRRVRVPGGGPGRGGGRGTGPVRRGGVAPRGAARPRRGPDHAHAPRLTVPLTYVGGSAA